MPLRISDRLNMSVRVHFLRVALTYNVHWTKMSIGKETLFYTLYPFQRHRLFLRKEVCVSTRVVLLFIRPINLPHYLIMSICLV